ncbi:MAG: M48 family metalloprotease [Vicinamibacteria bacterium]|nr:M48 family metalloprotease [Vicinamibacteria bacterium]
MTHDEFEALVRRAEALQREDPRAYRRRLAGWAALGFGYVGFALAAALALVGVAGWAMFHARSGRAAALKLAVVAAIFAWAVLRALWVRLERPQGLALTRGESPALFAAIDEVGAAVGVREPDEVLLTDEWNAAVTQVPRLGVFGWHRNSLILGLPLLHALSTAELRAVLAHEFGHLAGAHGRFGAWVYRVRATWARLGELFAGGEVSGAWVFRRFVAWYAPRFQAYSFAQARAQEHEADRVAARRFGARALADALVRLEVQAATSLSPYWERVFRGVAESPAPPAGVFAGLAREVAQAPAAGSAERVLEVALRRAGDVDDSHPPLRERLAALRQAPRLPPPVAEPGAAALLGAALPRVTRILETRWRETAREAWAERHAMARTARQRLAELETQGAEGAWTSDEALERARLLRLLEGPEAALSALAPLLAAVSPRPEAMFAAAELRLERDDDSGLDLLRRAIEADPAATVPACGLAFEYLMRHGRPDEARAFRRRLAERGELEEQAEAERGALAEDPADYGPHGLPPELEQEAQALLRSRPDIALAVLAERRVKVLPEHRCWCLVVVRRRRLFETEAAGRRAGEALLQALEPLRVPGELRTFVLAGTGQGTAKKLAKRVAGALVVRR